MDDSIKKGKTLVILLITFSLSISLWSIFIYNMNVGPQKIFPQIIRLGLTITLLFFLFKGREWAKNILGVLMILGAIIGFLGLVKVPLLSFNGLFSLITSMIYGFLGIILFGSKNIKEFLNYQRYI